MDDTQLKAALLDLAEFDFICLDSRKDAEQVLASLPDEIRSLYKIGRLYKGKGSRNLPLKFCLRKKEAQE